VVETVAALAANRPALAAAGQAARATILARHTAVLAARGRLELFDELAAEASRSWDETRQARPLVRAAQVLAPLAQAYRASR
jgi:hypothetical protein